MRQWVLSGRGMEYIKTTAILLILAVPFSFIVNCNSSSTMTSADFSEQALAFAWWFGPSGAPPKDTSGSPVEIGLALLRMMDETMADLSWTPPEGASAFEFEGIQPSNPTGPPPFLFSGVPARATTPSSPDLVVRYTPAAVGGDHIFVDTFTATVASGALQAFSVSHRAGTLSNSAGRPTIAGGGRWSKENAVNWRWLDWLYQHGAGDLERSQAEELVDYLQSGDFFIGLRFPVEQEADILDYQLPVVMMPETGAHLAILDHSVPWDGNDLSQAVVDLPMEYDPARQEFLENQLPQETATRWAALRPVQDPINIADRFPISGSNWEFFTTGVLDLSNMPNSCAECVLEVYFCHEGQEEPPFLDWLAVKAVASYQGEGVTCFGPSPVRLADVWGGEATDPPFAFGGPGFGKVDPPVQAELLHNITVTGSSSVSLVFEVESSMGLDWALYRGDFDNADLSRPLNGSLTLNPGSYEPIWIVGDVPADANGAETITLRAHAAGDVSQSIWTTTNLWIGDWVPPEEGQWHGWIPVVSHASGAQGSSWRSDLGLLNRGNTAVDALITLHAQSGALSISQAVPAGAQLILDDVVDLLAYTGSAALQISAPSQLVLSSRTYSLVGSSAACYPGGSLGQSLAGGDTESGLNAGQSALIPQLQENAAYRTNVAVINTGASQAQVRVHLLEGQGVELTSYDLSLDPGQWKQENRPFFNRAGQADLEAAYARIEVLSGGGILAYGSVVDNITNDPTTMAMVQESEAASTLWIPVASHAAGAQGSAWRTDLGLLCSGTASAEVNIMLHAGGGTLSMTQSLAAGQQLILADVVGRLSYTGSAALEIASTTALIVTSRTYSQVGSSANCYPDGTMGQSLGATPTGGGLSTGQSAVIPQLQENAAYRSNVAVINTGDSTAQVRVHLIDGDSTELWTYEVGLNSGEWKQENRPFFARAGISDLDAGYAMVEVISGSGIVSYGSVVDNTTNDPTTMPMIR